MQDFKTIYALYDSLKNRRERAKPLWDDISKVVGISVQPNYLWSKSASQDARKLDEFVDDPTSAIAVIQAGDYLAGILWGTGADVFRLVPSRYVLEMADESELEDFYNFATDQTLYHINHSDAGFSSVLQAHCYDQFAFGNSGIGCFPNRAFLNGCADNALIFRQFGVDNTCIDEGKAGAVDIVFATYHWRVNRIVGEFCMDGDQVSEEKLAKLPEVIRKAYQSGKVNDEYTIVFGMYPRADYDPKLKGKRGCKYKGVWFLEQNAENTGIFGEEDFAEKPIAFARMIKIRGEVYGRSSGTMLISTINSVNYMLAMAIEVIEKMNNPSLGVFSNALFGDAVLDSSPQGLTVFTRDAVSGSTPPTFPLYDVGDPAPLLQLLIPYLNDKIATAFKVDVLLDFSSAKEMTAAETLKRYIIRGKSLSGMLLQQKNECTDPVIRRAVSVLFGMDQLGVNPRIYGEQAAMLAKAGRQARIIPDAVLATMDNGRPWFEIRYNNELEKLTRTESVEALVQVIQAITAIAALNPQIIDAVDWYKLLRDINDNLDANNQILYSEDEFKAKIMAQAEQQKAMMMLQAGQVGADIQKNTAAANKSNSEALRVG